MPGRREMAPVYVGRCGIRRVDRNGKERLFGETEGSGG